MKTIKKIIALTCFVVFAQTSNLSIAETTTAQAKINAVSNNTECQLENCGWCE